MHPTLVIQQSATQGADGTKNSNKMKKLLLIASITTLMVGCGVSMPSMNNAPAPKAKLITTSSEVDVQTAGVYATPVVADLKVSTEKITHFYRPSDIVLEGGYDNVLKTAISEALFSNDNADVLVGMETQVKYTPQGQVESITITGYPAKYVNFRTDMNYQPAATQSAPEATSGTTKSSSGGGFLGGLF